MKSMRMMAMGVLLCTSGLALVGCTSAQKGAAGAGLVGGVAGAVIANNWATSVGPATGATIGAAGGAAVGGLAGDAYDQITDKDIRRELENRRAELAAKEAELAALQGQAPSPELLSQIDGLKARIGDLESQLQQARASADAANAEADRLRQSLAGTQTEKEQLQQEIEALRGQKDSLQKAIEDMQKEADQLREQINGKEETLGNLQRDVEGRDKEIAALEQALQAKQRQLADLEGQMNVLQTSLNGREQAVDELRAELAKMNVKLDETSRGLTLTIADTLLFNPGSADLTDGGHGLLAQVAGILNQKFPGRELLIEGHTDDRPIVHSGWRSNWELGAGRSLTILHELVDKHGMDPNLLSASSYGEFRPSTSNATADGRRANRRAVIVILPEKLPLQRKSLAAAN